RPAVARALARDPQARFPSCLDFVRALASSERPAAPTDVELTVPTGAEGGATRVVTGEPPAKARQRRRRAAMAGGCEARFGYRFLNCVARPPLGESWVVQGPDGRKEVARFLSGFEAPAEGADPFERLAALTPPGLLPLTLVHREPNRAVLLGLLGERT